MTIRCGRKAAMHIVETYLWHQIFRKFSK